MKVVQKNAAPSISKKKTWYYWVIVFACFLLSASCTGMLSNFNSLFISTVSDALRVKRAELALFSTCSSITAMLFLPLASKLYQRLPMRPLVLLGALCGAGAHLLYSLASSVFFFYLGGVLSGLCASFAGTVPINLLLSNWFYEKRGFATGIVYTGSSLIASLLSPAVSYILLRYGWRIAYRSISGCLLLTALPFLLLIRSKPADAGMLPYGQAGKGDSSVSVPSFGFTQKQTVHLLGYWLFAIGIFLLGVITSGTLQHLVAYWQTLGIAHSSAVRVYSLVLLTGVVGKLVIGALFDRFRVRTVLLLCSGVEIGAFIALLAFHSDKAVFLPASLFGITTAFQIILPAYLTQKFYGTRDFVANVGLIITMLYLGSSSGSPISALIFDLLGSYRPAWLLFIAASAAAFLCLLAANRLSSSTFLQEPVLQ